MTTSMRASIALFSLLLVPTAAADAQVLTPREIAARARPAVVLIHALTDGEATGQGSGFIVSRNGHVVTNRHVIEGATSLRIHLANGEVYDDVDFVSDDERRDLAILRISAPNLRWLPIGDDRNLAIGDRVYVMGNPRGLEGTFSDGLLSAHRTMDGIAMLQISAPISKGSSGGPVLNDKGEVVGVATLMIRDGQNLNMAVPARYAAGLLAMNERPVPFEQVASRFADDPATRSGDDDNLEPWQRVLAEEIALTFEAAKERGLRQIGEPHIDFVENEGFARVSYYLDPSEGMVVFVAVCDIDCTDIDLALYGPSGDKIDSDYEPDDRAAIAIDVSRAGTYTVAVYMAECSTDVCGYAVMRFAQR